MATISLPEVAPADRVRRGLILYRQRGSQIEPLGRGKYLVPGCSGDPYEVDLDVFGTAGGESCSCPDRARVCKHLVAATLYRAKIQRRSWEARRAEAQRRRRGALQDGDAGEILETLERMGA